MKLPRWLIAPYRELKRPTFPVEAKYLEKRGSVDNVKPVIRIKRAPIDYERGLPIG